MNEKKGIINYLNEYGGVITNPEITTYRYEHKVTKWEFIQALIGFAILCMIEPLIWSLTAICILGVLLNAT